MMRSYLDMHKRNRAGTFSGVTGGDLAALGGLGTQEKVPALFLLWPSRSKPFERVYSLTFSVRKTVAPRLLARTSTVSPAL